MFTRSATVHVLREQPIDLRPVGAIVFKSDLEMLKHIYKETIPAEKGLIMLEQRGQEVAAMTAPNQRHASLQSHTDPTIATVMATATRAATQQRP